MPGRLDGLKIIDVIKVESPEGDTVRHLGPMRHPGMSAGFLHVNRNKRSVVLDLKSASGREALLELVRTADAFVSNVRPTAMARLGLDHAALSKVNPAIICMPLAIVDRVVGQAAATALLAAVIHCMKTGRGQAVEIPMFETMVPYVDGALDRDADSCRYPGDAVAHAGVADA